MSLVRETPRPHSAPTFGDLHHQEGQERGDQFLSVNRSNTRGGLAPSTLRQEPTTSSSGSSRNDYSSEVKTKRAVPPSLENGTKVNSEATASAVPSSAASTENHDPWKRKTLLTLGNTHAILALILSWLSQRLDGGGIRGYSSLLILHAVMVQIATIERKEPQALHSAHPLPPRTREPVRITRSKTTAPVHTESTVFGPSESSHYFPSHYFDYIAGTSTGG